MYLTASNLRGGTIATRKNLEELFGDVAIYPHKGEQIFMIRAIFPDFTFHPELVELGKTVLHVVVPDAPVDAIVPSHDLAMYDEVAFVTLKGGSMPPTPALVLLLYGGASLCVCSAPIDENIKIEGWHISTF